MRNIVSLGRKSPFLGIEMVSKNSAQTGRRLPLHGEIVWQKIGSDAIKNYSKNGDSKEMYGINAAHFFLIIVFGIRFL